MVTHVTAPIHAARAIVRGDVSYARACMIGVRSLRVCEARALIGACDEARERYGCELDWLSFLDDSPMRRAS